MPKKPTRSGGRRRKGPKPPKPGSMDALVPSKLTENQINERARRLARKTVELRALEARKKKAVRSIGQDIKAVREECEKLAEEITHGEEMVRQGDLFAPKRDTEKAPPEKASRTLAEIGRRAADEPTGPRPAA